MPHYLCCQIKPGSFWSLSTNGRMDNEAQAINSKMPIEKPDIGTEKLIPPVLNCKLVWKKGMTLNV